MLDLHHLIAVVAIAGCDPDAEPIAPIDAAAPARSCLDGGPLPVLPTGVAFVDPQARANQEPETLACSALVRVASSLLSPEFAAAHPTVNGGITYSYVYRSEDSALVMIDGGWGRWVTGIVNGVPQLAENRDARTRLETAISALAPGKGLADIVSIAFEHAHPDHTGQAELVQRAKGAPLDLWVGSGDAAMLRDPARLETCTGGLPMGTAQYLPYFAAPDYVIHEVPTSAPATTSADWVDAGHGVTLIPAPGHTPGSLIVYLPALGVTITGNHLDPDDAGTTGDCGTAAEASGCPVACNLYAASLRAFPPAANALHVHPLAYSE